MDERCIFDVLIWTHDNSNATVRVLCDRLDEAKILAVNWHGNGTVIAARVSADQETEADTYSHGVPYYSDKPRPSAMPQVSIEDTSAVMVCKMAHKHIMDVVNGSESLTGSDVQAMGGVLANLDAFIEGERPMNNMEEVMEILSIAFGYTL